MDRLAAITIAVLSLLLASCATRSLAFEPYSDALGYGYIETQPGVYLLMTADQSPTDTTYLDRFKEDVCPDCLWIEGYVDQYQVWRLVRYED